MIAVPVGGAECAGGVAATGAEPALGLFGDAFRIPFAPGFAFREQAQRGQHGEGAQADPEQFAPSSSLQRDGRCREAAWFRAAGI